MKFSTRKKNLFTLGLALPNEPGICDIGVLYDFPKKCVTDFFENMHQNTSFGNKIDSRQNSENDTPNISYQ